MTQEHGGVRNLCATNDMEIYEKRHVVKAVVDAVTYLLPTVLGCMITAIAISPTTFNTTISASDWLWYSLVSVAAFIILPLGLNALYFFSVRYYYLCLLKKPALVITDSELHVFSPYRGYNVISWDEIAEFKDSHFTKFRKLLYPVYKDAKRNKNILLRGYLDGILTDYLTMKEEYLLEKLNSHLTK